MASTFNELVEETKDINLEELGIILGSPAVQPSNVGFKAIGCYKDGNEWVLEEVSKRGKGFVIRGTEEMIVGKAHSHITLRKQALDIVRA